MKRKFYMWLSYHAGRLAVWAAAKAKASPIVSYEAFAVADYHHSMKELCHICGKTKDSYRKFSTGLVACFECLTERFK